MEISVPPHAFSVLAEKHAGRNGELVDVMVVVVIDQTGNVVKIPFVLEDWTKFQRHVADPENAAAAAQARSAIVDSKGHRL